jgi:hypothetical protein
VGTPVLGEVAVLNEDLRVWNQAPDRDGLARSGPRSQEGLGSVCRLHGPVGLCQDVVRQLVEIGPGLIRGLTGRPCLGRYVASARTPALRRAGGEPWPLASLAPLEAAVALPVMAVDAKDWELLFQHEKTAWVVATMSLRQREKRRFGDPKTYHVGDASARCWGLSPTAVMQTA